MHSVALSYDVHKGLSVLIVGHKYTKFRVHRNLASTGSYNQFNGKPVGRYIRLLVTNLYRILHRSFLIIISLALNK